MKKILAMLLAFCLVWWAVPPVYADDVPPDQAGQVPQEDATTQTDDPAGPLDGEPLVPDDDDLGDEPSDQVFQADDQPEAVPSSQHASVGEVRVSIAAALALAKDLTFDVALAGPADKSGTITLGAESSGEPLRFSQLPDGAYRLTVTAPGFAPYSQEVVVEQGGVDVMLATGFLGGMDYEAGSNHPGVLLAGDVNGDGAIDTTDLGIIIDTIEGADANPGFVTDLTGDGVTDVADLEYFCVGYQESAHTATLGNFVPAGMLSGSVGTGTQVADGAIEQMLQHNGTVQLSTADGQPISDDNPISLTISLDNDTSLAASQADGILIETDENTHIEAATLDVTYIENGTEHTATIPLRADAYALTESDVYAQIDAHGNIVVHLGGQVAVKKITLSITGVEGQASLAEISKVEFVNGMDKRIPEPEMNIPQQVVATPGSQQFSVKWGAEVNITGYEVLVWRDGDKATTQTFSVAHNMLDVTSLPNIGDGKVKNLTTYWVQVRSVNGAWHSDYSQPVSVTPRPQGRPPKPDNVTATGMYRSIAVSWKQMDDTESYILSYRAKGSSAAYTQVRDITASTYQILGLEDKTEYEIYVQGVNEFGEGERSLLAQATTTDLQPAQMPKYKLINYPDGDKQQVSTHITAATHAGTSAESKRQMVNSPLDAAANSANSALGTVDNNPQSYYQRFGWNDGGDYAGGGLTYTFDKAYEMDAFAFTNARAADSVSPDPYIVRVNYDGCPATNGITVSPQKRTDKDGRAYFFVQLPEKISTQTLSIGQSVYPQQGDRITVSEIYFYNYDSLWDDILALYEDDMHTVLKQSVGQTQIDGLKDRLEQTDPTSGEKHYDYDQLKRELQNAEDILNAKNLSPSYVVHNDIVQEAGVNRGFGGINDWQPLGVTAAAGDKITVYVGHTSQITGQAVRLQLVFTQYHAESSALSATPVNLKVGTNLITVPKIGSLGEQESGGALYVRYTGSATSAERYAVRVNGGTQVATLDLHGVSDHNQRIQAATAYLKQLKAQVDAMQQTHEDVHQGEGEASRYVNLPYDGQNCIAGATDIVLDTMMYSVPAAQILSGCGGDAAKLVTSLDAMEQMMHLFYQHKGLSADADDAVDRIPAGHLNIRYMRMFAGAFMYASGNHIGVEYTETDDLASCGGVQADAQGRYQGGDYFGWGFAHEIGHNINQSSYAIAEITNNYFAQLAQAQDKNEGMRWGSYQKVFDKVTSGEKGDSTNIAVQLALYWQLHLAYDSGYNYATYDAYADQLANLFYARMNTYARTPSKAPKAHEGGVALNLKGADKDQTLMRLACAASQRDLLEFFEHWGKTPNQETIAYAAQFPKETRAIWYANDDSRAYARTGASTLADDGSTEAVTQVQVSVDKAQANKVHLAMQGNLPADRLLGYEIVRVVYAPDADVTTATVLKTPVGFTTTGSFTDTVLTINNRAVCYEVTAVDHYLHRSKAKATEPVKISHEGDLDQTNWTLSVHAMTPDTSDAKQGFFDDDVKDTPQTEDVLQRAIDNDASTVLTLTMDGAYDAGADVDKARPDMGFGPYVEIDLGGFETISGMRFTPGGTGTMPQGYAVYLCTPENEWQAVSSSTFDGMGAQTVFFENAKGDYVGTYKAKKLMFMPTGLEEGQSFGIAELDVLGVTGDNIDFRTTADSGQTLIGVLDADYVYEQSSGAKIPKGSLVFMGSYKGNAAYNVVALYDQDGKLVVGTDGEAHQVILADVPDAGAIQNVKDGTWVYWLAPNAWQQGSLPAKVRAELYRVNDANTNDGQRLVSDTLFENVPTTLEHITLDR